MDFNKTCDGVKYIYTFQWRTLVKRVINIRAELLCCTDLGVWFVACFEEELLPPHMPAGSEQNHENSQDNRFPANNATGNRGNKDMLLTRIRISCWHNQKNTTGIN
jgi:hypothetical protein